MEIGRLFSSRSYAPLQAGLAELGPRVLAVPPDLKMQASCLPWRCRAARRQDSVEREEDDHDAGCEMGDLGCIGCRVRARQNGSVRSRGS